MRNKFTLVLMATVIAITGIFATNTAEAAKRKVVLEDHTGAWCGWCPMGMDALETLEDQHGDMVIGIAVHNGDGMAIASYQGPLAQEMGVGGYPSGTISRKIMANGSRAQHPLATQNNNTPWVTGVSSLVNTDVPVGATVVTDYDKATGDFTTTVTIVVESDLNYPLTANLWAIEDYMRGSGGQWDQQNYLSGRNGYQSSPYYNKPAVVTNFEHNDVFRGATSGLNGTAEPFPSGNTPAGTYTFEVSGNVTEDLNVENPLNAYFVAVVQNASTKEIINADRTERPHYTMEAIAPTLAPAQTEIYKFVPDTESRIHKIAVTNNNSVESLHRLVIHSSSLIPDGWDVEVKNAELGANASGEFEIEVNPNGNAGMATIIYRTFAQVPDSKNWASQSNVFTLSATTERIYFEASDRYSYLVLPDIASAPEFKNYARCLISPSQLDALEPNLASMIKTAVFTINDGQYGLAGANTAANLTTIKKLMANGTNVLLSAPADVRIVGGNIPNIPPTADGTDFFKNTLGVDFGIQLGLVQNQQYVPFPVMGVGSDPISSGVSFNTNVQGVYRGVQELPTMSLNGNSDATAFLEGPTTDPLNANNNKLGIKLDKDGQRTILLTLGVDYMHSSARNTLAKNMIKWLEGGSTQATGPKLSLSTQQVAFGEVEVGKMSSETRTITNKGGEKLIITSISLKDAIAFSIKPGTLPLTIDAGQSVNIAIEFSPTAEQAYTDQLVFVSNDSDNPNTIINISGTGVAGVSSVPGVISDLFDMTVTQNPIIDNSEIRFNVTGSANVNIELIDATGRTVSSLYSGVTTGGTVELNASQLSSGSYYINANVDGKSTQIPVVITK